MKTKDYILCGLFAAIITISAVLTIPLSFTPVPITLQVMTVFITPAVLGHKKGVIAVGVYILLGFIGLPVFSGMKGGIGVLAGPTGGYILGFLPAVFLCGFMVFHLMKIQDSVSVKLIKYFVFMFSGLCVLYVFGTIQLMFIGHMDLISALSAAVLPFVGFDIVKLVLAVPVCYYIRQNVYNIHLQKNASEIVN